MIRLLSYITLGIIILYGLEHLGVVKKQQILSHLPRLEKADNLKDTHGQNTPVNRSSFTERVSRQARQAK